MRYIDADKLQEVFKELHGGKRSLLIDTEPTADVRENVRGEWVTPTEKVHSIDGEDITSAYKECNRCHKVYVRTNDNYCPNCGADMRGEQNDKN